MTVEELIEALGRLPGELPVYVRGYAGGVNDVDTLMLVDVMRDRNTSDIYGAHEIWDADDAAGDGAVAEAEWAAERREPGVWLGHTGTGHK